MIRIVINERPIEAREGATVLEASRRAGFHIPTLCHYEPIKPYGGCRLCLVEVTQAGRTQLTTACTYPVAPDLKVLTDTEEVAEARRFVMDLILSRSPEVPALQEMARQLGVCGPGFSTHKETCILCGKCVRVCHELQHVGAIGFMGRGAGREVTTPFGEVSPVCRTCGACAFVCPTGHIADLAKISGKTPIPKLSEFNVGLSTRGNIHRLYPQAVPSTPTIDGKNCIRILTGDCGVCAEVCEAGAVDYDQKPQEVSLNVGSVILAPGFQPFDPTGYERFAYHHPNVVTTLEFERMLSPGGPLKGHIARRSDGKEPRKIAWIQCVGSRSEQEGFHPYCSGFCCMASLKQTMIAKEHLGPDLDTAVFFMDMRTHRKDFEKYYQRAQDLGGRLIRSRVHSVLPQRDTGDLFLQYVTEHGETREETFEMVVLATGLSISPETREMAERLGIELDPNHFVSASCFEPVGTSRPGVYACGVFTGPKDIPQTVTEGSAAAAQATRNLAVSRGSLLKEKSYPPEKDVAGQTPRIGVFICHCGINIGGVADVPAIAEYARTIPNVEFVQENLFSCSQDAQKQMAERIREQDLNRVVVAACTPSTHQPIFQDMLRNAGLNKYLFEMANIRNQCTWVHQNAPQKATEKSKDLIRMAVAKARLIESLEYITVPIHRKALVIGGGVAGLTSAMALADQGYYVDLVERKDRLGGNALKLHTSWRKERIHPFVYELIANVENHDKITVHLGNIVVGVEGTVGNFKSRLSNGIEIRHGIVIICIGAEPLRPEGQYLYKRHPNVILSLDLDRELARQSRRVQAAEAVAFIQCVGSRIPERPYCNKVCCTHAVENALRLKDMDPDMDVYILYRDMRTIGQREELFREARRRGVMFFRYDLDDPPRVDYFEDRIRISLTDHVLRRPVELVVDLLTLATAIVPHQNAPLAELYKVPLNAEGFFTEAHAKIRPVDASSAGIFLAGLCHYPKPIQESIAEALATASRANTILSRTHLELDSTVSHPIDENCDGCAFCVDACPFKAITLMEYIWEGAVKKTVDVDETVCKGCGSCMATCPKKGIYVSGFSLDQLGAQVDAALGLV
jgi:heterodisulfide reductase subunit A